MRYRIKKSEVRYEKKERKPYRRAGADSPRRFRGGGADEIDMETLFELYKLDGATEVPKKRKKSAAAKAVISVFSAIRRALRSVCGAISRKIKLFVRKRRARREKTWVIPTLAGAFAGILVVSALSAFAVLYKLMISDYFGRYEKVSVPYMVGESLESAKAMLDEKYFNVSVSFEYSGTVPEGEVISQSPSANVERKIYKSGSLPTVSLVVSRGKETFIMTDYVGTRARDAALELKNMGIAIEIDESYSDEFAAGEVISSMPAGNESVAVDEVVTLRVSLGKKKYFASVPSLIGLTESRATSRISSSGLKVGSVSYRASGVPAGLVIGQSVEPYSSAEYGTRISLEISAGETFYEKVVPSLYGMTLDAAKSALADYGLIAGDIYAVNSSEPEGTVISQSPPAGSDITSSVVSVDIYVSS